MAYFYVLKCKKGYYTSTRNLYGVDPCDEKTFYWEKKTDAQNRCIELNNSKVKKGSYDDPWKVERHNNNKPNCVQLRLHLKDQFNSKTFLTEEVLEGSRALNFPPVYFSYPRNAFGCIPLKDKEKYIEEFLEKAIEGGQNAIKDIQKSIDEVKEFAQERKNANQKSKKC